MYNIAKGVLEILYDIGYNGAKGDDNVFKRRKTIIRVVSVVLCIMMVLGVFSVLMYSVGGFQ